MFATVLMLCALAFAESKELALQICLDRAGFACNVIDGTWGPKSQRALVNWCAAQGVPVPATPVEAFDRHFANETNLFCIQTVTEDDLKSLVTIPKEPSAKALLPKMGYESIREMFAERGHVSVRALERMNPGVDWEHVPSGLRLVLPNFPPISEELAAGDRGRPRGPKRPLADRVRISISRCEVTVEDAGGKTLAFFPCSVAKNKAKLPPHGELRVTTYVAWPNYTYTPDFTPKGRKVVRHIWPEGPNCPVGVAWLGLNLPGYGIHGTPHPETIGKAESHGCFRLSNWNAARLYGMCRSGTRVLIEP